jgi:hypothetical protein
MVNKPWISLEIYLPNTVTFMSATWASWTSKTSQTAEVVSGMKLSGLLNVSSEYYLTYTCCHSHNFASIAATLNLLVFLLHLCVASCLTSPCQLITSLHCQCLLGMSADLPWLIHMSLVFKLLLPPIRNKCRMI